MGRPRWGAALGLLLAAALASTAAGGELYVSPEGKDAAKGTKEDPLSLRAAMGASSPARPGDIFWLLGGTYRGPFLCQVKGAAGAPVTFRAAPGQRATLDCRLPPGAKGPPHLTVQGGWTVFWGLEVTCSDPRRVTKLSGSHPGDIQRGGVNAQADWVRFINLLVHDCDGGFGFWSGGEGGEIYGCIIYNNGWVGPDRGHGHAIYAQNKTGIKDLVDNVLFNQFSYGIHAYGSSRAFLSGFHVEGNVSFNNGSAAAPDSRTPAILIGGGGPAERITVLDNYTYGDGRGGGDVRLGYSWGKGPNKDVAARGNYVVGTVSLLYWAALAFEGNTVISAGRLVGLEMPRDDSKTEYRFAGNTYLRTGKQGEPFSLNRKGQAKSMGLADWRKEGYDADSSYAESAPAGVKVIVRANRYEPGRAHVIVYNWEGRGQVGVDLSGVLRRGGRYRVVSAQDFFGEAVAEGVFDGGPVSLPMRAYRAPAPIGMPDHQPPVTGPTFNVFVVLPGQ